MRGGVLAWSDEDILPELDHLSPPQNAMAFQASFTQVRYSLEDVRHSLQLNWPLGLILKVKKKKKNLKNRQMEEDSTEKDPI